MTSVPGIVLGIIALNRIKNTGQEGRGQAIAGIVMGVATLILGVALLIWANNPIDMG